jgi:nucleoid DNA-binding protein
VRVIKISTVTKKHFIKKVKSHPLFDDINMPLINTLFSVFLGVLSDEIKDKKAISFWPIGQLSLCEKRQGDVIHPITGSKSAIERGITLRFRRHPKSKEWSTKQDISMRFFLSQTSIGIVECKVFYQTFFDILKEVFDCRGYLRFELRGFGTFTSKTKNIHGGGAAYLLKFKPSINLISTLS